MLLPLLSNVFIIHNRNKEFMKKIVANVPVSAHCRKSNVFFLFFQLLFLFFLYCVFAHEVCELWIHKIGTTS